MYEIKCGIKGASYLLKLELQLLANMWYNNESSVLALTLCCDNALGVSGLLNYVVMKSD